MNVTRNTCRLCLLDNAVVKIFEHGKLNILEMIKTCCQFEIIEEENLPRKLCLKCLNTLNICNDFLLQCIQNNKKLLQQGIKIDNDIIKVEQKYLIKCEFDNGVDAEIYDSVPNSIEMQYDDKQVDNAAMEPSNDSQNIKKSKIHTKLTNILLNAQSQDPPDKIMCDVCGKVVKRKAIKVHKERHSSERKYGCDSCHKKFKVRETLQKHIKSVHKSTGVICDICKKVYSCRSNLKAHLETVHTMERKFVCDLCPKKFKRKDFLQLHMITHTQERAFNCRFCDSTFTLKKTKIEHERLHMGITPYKCPSCHKAFTQLNNMKSHFKHNHKDIVFSEVYQPVPRGRTTVAKNN